MKIIFLTTQIKNNLLAIIGLVVALTALSYDTWRNEHTEKNRNIRVASFELLKELGALQIVVNYSFYQRDSTMGNPYLGWGHIAYISDLSQLLPQPIPGNVDKLTEVWKSDWEKIKSNSASVENISTEIDHSRESVLAVLRQLK